MFWLLKFAIFGFIAGAIARLLHPGRDPMNWLWTMLLGIAGSVVGGWIGSALGFDVDQGFMAWVTAVGGAVLLLFIYHYATTRSTPQGRVATTDGAQGGALDNMSRGPTG
jgi:uncharacterized membrane protein YeaQ/YmgE (transglycosylase-associated protein family)